MKTKVSPVIFLIGAVGFVCLGYAFAFGLEHGFSFSWEGNWSPVIIGLVGAALLAVAATANAMHKRARGGQDQPSVRDRGRTFVEAMLTFSQYAGVFFVMWGFVFCLMYARSGRDVVVPLYVAVSGIVLNRVGAHFLSLVREPRVKKETTFVSPTEDERDP